MDEKFKELSEDEVQKLKADELAVYIKDLNEFRVAKTQKAIEEQIKNLVSQDDFKKLSEQIKSLNDANAENLEVRIKEFEKLTEKFADKVNSTKDLENSELPTFAIKLMKAKELVSGKNVKETLENFKSGDKFSFTVKFSSGDVTGTPHGSQIVAGIGQIATAKSVLSNFFKVSPIQIDNQGIASYDDWDKDTIVRAAAAIAEGTTFPTSTAKFVRKSITIEKTGDTIGMTYESIRDYARFVAELARFITRNISIKVNQALWNGTGVTPNIAGIYTRVTEMTTASVTAREKTANANLVDLIKVASNRILNGKDEKYMPNVVFVSHNDNLTLEIAKDSTSRLLYPNGIQKVGNVLIVPTSFVPDNQLVIGDSEFVELIGDPNAIQIEGGLRTGDWEDDKESIKGRVRTCLLIRDADLDGFLKVTDITAMLTALTA